MPMQIEHARIAIRERTWLDNLDLSLQVLRTNFKSVVFWSLVGVLPAMAFNFAIIYWLFSDQLVESAAGDSVIAAVLLVMIEAPLAMSLLTLFLGQTLFVEQADGRRIVREFVQALPQLLLLQLVLRIPLILFLLTWLVPYGLWPYLNELILLERNPLVSRGGQMSTRRRNAVFHQAGGGDYLLRALGAGLISALLIVAGWESCDLVLDMLLGVQTGWMGQMLTLQIVLWSIAVFFTISRFLAYLDQRIRTEGWEAELALRAQRDRLARHAA
jgi:hypothetical protein